MGARSMSGQQCQDVYRLNRMKGLALGKKGKLKGIQSLRKRIREHQEKLSREKSKPAPNTALVEYWEKEIRKFENEIKKKQRQLLRRRGKRK